MSGISSCVCERLAAVRPRELLHYLLWPRHCYLIIVFPPQTITSIERVNERKNELENEWQPSRQIQAINTVLAALFTHNYWELFSSSVIMLW